MFTVEWQRKFEGLTLKYETHAWRAGDILSQESSQLNFQQACVRRPVRARLSRPIGSQSRLGTLVLTPADFVLSVDATGDETEFPVRKFEMDTDWFSSLVSPELEFDFSRVNPHPVFDHPNIARTLERISTELLMLTSDSAELLRCLVRMLAIDTARLLRVRAVGEAETGTMLTNDQLASINWLIETTDFAELSPSRVASDCDMSLPRLREAYRRTTGQSLREGIEEARQTSACRLLTVTGHPLKIIAHRVGFAHPSAFCYWFKRSVGLTPTEYRMRNAGHVNTTTNNGGGIGACYMVIKDNTNRFASVSERLLPIREMPTSPQT